jgi:chitin disaccharide deacetylase
VLRARARLDQLEMEFRAQIEAVLAAGLKPAHLDWHALRFGERTDIIDLMIRLAEEYGLALRVIGRSMIEKLQNQGLPTIDYDFLDSSSIDSKIKSARFAQLLHELPTGLSEWAVHPGLDNAELLALEPTGNHVRQSDFDFLISPAAQEIVKEEGIILVDYQALQTTWNSIGFNKTVRGN